jgi:hypothetical protein
MAYGINNSPLLELQREVRRLPVEISGNPREFEALLFSFLDAFRCLLALDARILLVCAERAGRRSYVRLFLPVFDEVTKRVLSLLEMEIREGLEAERSDLTDMANAIRDSSIANEMVILDQALDESEGTAEPEEHLDTAETVTNSVKEIIKKFAKRRWMESVLRALDEIISIIRGLV